MIIRWTGKGAQDLARLHDFLAPHNPDAATRIVQELVVAPDKLVAFPRRGQVLSQYQPREVRRLLIGDYEMRYEIASDTIFILRIWHARENRTNG